MLAKLGNDCSTAPYEYSGIPEIIPCGDLFLCGRLVWFLLELLDLDYLISQLLLRMDVSVTSLGTGRLDTDGDYLVSPVGEVEGLAYRRGELLDIDNAIANASKRGGGKFRFGGKKRKGNAKQLEEADFM